MATVAEWQSSTSHSGLFSLNLDDPGPGWAVRKPLGRLDPGVAYSGWGVNDGTAGAAYGVDFPVSDLKSLPPGKVRYATGEDKATGRATYALVPEDEFDARACERVGK